MVVTCVFELSSLGWCSHLYHTLTHLDEDGCLKESSLSPSATPDRKGSDVRVSRSSRKTKVLRGIMWCSVSRALHSTAVPPPVGDPQLVSLSANTHLVMSPWSPTRSAHQPGANYFCRGVQPGPHLGSSSF